MARQKPPTDSQRARRARELANRKVVLKAREDVRVVDEQRRVEAAATRDAVRLELLRAKLCARANLAPCGIKKLLSFITKHSLCIDYLLVARSSY